MPNKIAYTSYRLGPGYEPVDRNSYLIDLTDGSQRPLAPTLPPVYSFAWSPNGQQIALWSGTSLIIGYGLGLFIIDAAGSNLRRLNLRRLIGEDASAAALAWSPDSTRIAFASAVRGVSLIDADGSHLRHLIDAPISLISHLVWCPDSQELSFLADLDGTYGWYKLDPQTGLLRLIAPNIAEPVWSPRGQHIAYVLRPHEYDEIWLMDADGSHQHRLIELEKWADAPSWSPDGKHIACRTAADYTEPILTVIDADGSHAREVTELAIDAFFAWSPDGKQLAFTAYTPDFQYALGVVDANGANLRHLVTNIHGDDPGEMLPDTPVWSPDGRHIAYTSYLEGGENLYSIDADGANLRRLTNSQEDEFIAGFDWQPET